MSGVGGYVRRCERKTAPVVRLRGDARIRHTVLPLFQVMPILRFEPFDVMNAIDRPGMKDIGLAHGNHTA